MVLNCLFNPVVPWVRNKCPVAARWLITPSPPLGCRRKPKRGKASSQTYAVEWPNRVTSSPEWKTANRVKPGAKLLCYLTKVSRWVGVSQVVEGPVVDETPIFFPEDDPYVVRFKIEPLVWLPVELGIPIHEDEVWNQLSITRELEKSSTRWTGKFRSSLVQLPNEDGAFLEKLLHRQAEDGKEYPFDRSAYEKHLTKQVRGLGKLVSVSVPDASDHTEEAESPAPPTVREGIHIQALLASIGERMGFKIWLPKRDRAGVLAE